MFDDSMKDLLGLHVVALFEEYNLSPNPVDIISFNNIFIIYLLKLLLPED